MRAAAGVELPVLADLGTTAVLRFSELFGNEEDESQAPPALQKRPRQPRQDRQPSESSHPPAFFLLLHSSAILQVFS